MFELSSQVLNGLLDCEEGAKRGFCYARDIVQFSDMKRIDERLGDKVWRYIDTDQDEENVDKQAQKVQKELRQQVKDHGVPMRLYTVSWAKKVMMKNLLTHEILRKTRVEMLNTYSRKGASYLLMLRHGCSVFHLFVVTGLQRHEFIKFVPIALSGHR